MFTRFALIVAVAAITTGCRPPGKVKIAYDQGFEVQDAIFIPKLVDGQVIAGDIVLADAPNLCDSVRRGIVPSRMKSLTFRVFRITETAFLAPDVGEYKVLDAKPTRTGNFAFGELVESDLNCTQTLDARRSVIGAGRVEIEHFEAGDRGVIGGMFTTYRHSTLFDSYSELVEGRFDADYCATPFEKFSCR
jgi:hypothetical protein